jgi:hypothetical protein
MSDYPKMIYGSSVGVPVTVPNATVEAEVRAGRGVLMPHGVVTPSTAKTAADFIALENAGITHPVHERKRKGR